MKTNILILCAGEVSFETQDGDYPLCFTEMGGVSLLEKIVTNTKTIQNAQYVFALLNEDIERFHLDKIVRLLAPGSKVISLPESTQGSACTALLAACQLDPNNSLLIVSGNEFVDIDFAQVIDNFCHQKMDGGTLTIRSVHPRYSYVRLNSEGLVTEAAQQNPISHHATAGVFWFAKGGDFIESAKNLIRKDASVNGKFFVAPTFNELILQQGRIGVINLDISQYHPLKSKRQMQKFEQAALV